MSAATRPDTRTNTRARLRVTDSSERADGLLSAHGRSIRYWPQTSTARQSTQKTPTVARPPRSARIDWWTPVRSPRNGSISAAAARVQSSVSAGAIFFSSRSSQSEGVRRSSRCRIRVVTPPTTRPATSASAASTGSASHCHHITAHGPVRCRRSGIASRIQRSGSSSYQPSMRWTVCSEKAQRAPVAVRVCTRNTLSIPPCPSGIWPMLSTPSGSPSSRLPSDAGESPSSLMSRWRSSTARSRRASSAPRCCSPAAAPGSAPPPRNRLSSSPAAGTRAPRLAASPRPRLRARRALPRRRWSSAGPEAAPRWASPMPSHT